ncbi:MAG TPA: GNAT family N-acetyltransferase [Actinomycetota bacterium]|nr:GNAT family N-acetyltransferase [Actinomycetota bacterium]
MGEARIALAGVDALPSIEPLTRSLHEHHRTVDPAIPGVPLRDTDAWWAVRSERYRAWLAEPDTFLLVAEDDGVAAGYALVTFRERDDSNATGDRFAELQSLAVTPDRRGEGLGTALLHEVYREVRRRGAEEMVIGVLATNEAAMRLYEREGFRPWVVLTLGKLSDPDAT